jgi:hypothetical protein
MAEGRKEFRQKGGYQGGFGISNKDGSLVLVVENPLHWGIGNGESVKGIPY